MLTGWYKEHLEDKEQGVLSVIYTEFIAGLNLHYMVFIQRDI